MGGGTRRSAKRAVAWAAAAFLGLQAALGVVTDADAVAVRDPDYAFRADQLRNVRARHPDRAVVLVLGTSRSLAGIDAKSLTDRGGPVVYNFGLPGAGPARLYAVWHRLVADGLRPDAVVVETLPALHTRAGQGLFEKEWNDAGRLSLAELAALAPRYAKPYQAAWRWATARAMPLTRYPAAAYRGYFGGSAPAGPDYARRADAFGWMPGTAWQGAGPEQVAKSTAMALQQYRTACGDPRPAPASELFDRLLADIRSAGVPVACVTMPEAAAFRALHDGGPAPTPPDRVADACGRHGVAFTDARGWLPDDAFWDGHHLLPAGARAFTDRLGTDVLAALAARR